jgi:hypothetical protein
MGLKSKVAPDERHAAIFAPARAGFPPERLDHRPATGDVVGAARAIRAQRLGKRACFAERKATYLCVSITP